MKSLTLRTRDGVTFNPGSPSLSLSAAVKPLGCFSLTQLAVHDFGPSFAEQGTALPVHWSNLTFLSLHPHHAQPFHQEHLIPILASCTNLVHCSVTLGTKRDLQFTSGASEIRLHKLQILELSGSEPHTRGLASRLALPLLTQLSIVFTSSNPTDPQHSSTVEWISRFGHQLSDVTFDYLSLTQSSLVHCLSRLPNVVRLKLVGKSMDNYHCPTFNRQDENRNPPALINDNILTMLTPRLPEALLASDEADARGGPVMIDHRCLCPKLRRLECMMGPLEFGEASFLRLIFARYGDGKMRMRDGVCRLEEVVLSYNRVLLDVSEWEEWAEDRKVTRTDTTHLAFTIQYLNVTPISIV
ncbi:hypothetical protein NMY22_g16645 [Coprinellus aureogranulatus]|nr:hypothetical protein NMY22_g16645 [Coprinellus aureogranulatus]